MLPSVKCCRSTVLVRTLPHAREVAPALVLTHVAQDAARTAARLDNRATRIRLYVFFAAVETMETRKAPA